MTRGLSEGGAHAKCDAPGWGEGSAHLSRELPLGILRSPQVLDQLFIFHCALQQGKGRKPLL